MRWVVAIGCVFVGAFAPSCTCNAHHAGLADSTGDCLLDCPTGEVCRYQTCVRTPTPCTTNLDCPGDQYCDTTRDECLPWGVGPGGGSDPGCKREPVPGVFFPGVQCEWLGPPALDLYPNHVNVLATPMVATFYSQGELSTPSIVFTSYNFTDGGNAACMSSIPASYYGVLRVIDGRTCTQQATIDSPTLVASASVAIADIGGLDATPEIVAARSDGGLVAFTLNPVTGWQVLWQTASTFGDNLCDWAGPSIHDLDDDGIPEILFYGNVYDANGNALDETLGAGVDGSFGVGYLPVAADLDGDGIVELVTGSEIYSWNKLTKKWNAKTALPGPNGHVAVADFGTFPASGMDDRSQLDGIAEIAVIASGVAHVYTVDGRQIFTAAIAGTGYGGPPTIADFDGDGRVELSAAGATFYSVLDPDCRNTPDPAFCPSLTTNGIAWAQPSQDSSSNVTGSSVFDFDGDGRAEVVYGDECFTRVYDGKVGKVLYSRYRTSCTWYENPVIADVDADFNAEIISTSNTNCGVGCPPVDPIFDGVACLDDSDCPTASGCGREAPGDALGRCRCTSNLDCGGDGFVCLDPIAGASAAGKVCRASHPPGAAATGVRVLADNVDRWVNTRPIWNQHNYSVTNIDQSGKVPRTSQWLQNWKQPGLNNYRANSPGDGVTAGAIPDLTVKQAKVTCDPGGPVITAEVCNRGTEPVAPGVPVAFYAAGPPRELRCESATMHRIDPGICTVLSCTWTGAGGDAQVVVDDRGNGTGIDFECREDNNELGIAVDCP